jgi:hypothetical protein
MLRALHGQPGGSWMIVSEMFSDADHESTYRAGG